MMAPMMAPKMTRVRRVTMVRQAARIRTNRMKPVSTVLQIQTKAAAVVLLGRRPPVGFGWLVWL